MKQPLVVTKESNDLSSSAAQAQHYTRTLEAPNLNGLNPSMIKQCRLGVANAFKNGIGKTRMGQAGTWLAGRGGGLLKLEVAKKEFDAASTDEALADWLGKWMTTTLSAHLQTCLFDQQRRLFDAGIQHGHHVLPVFFD